MPHYKANITAHLPGDPLTGVEQDVRFTAPAGAPAEVYARQALDTLEQDGFTMRTSLDGSETPPRSLRIEWEEV